MAPHSILSLAILALAGSALGQSVDGAKYDFPSGGPPGSFFAASTRLPVSALQSAAARASIVPPKATYPVSREPGAPLSTLHSDWVNFRQGAALSWVADMDVDCDGKDWKCNSNGDGQPQTNWGTLAAYEVPWIVIPDQVLTANPTLLPGNNVAAVICNGNMFYGILGDTNGDNPQITGEASWVMARTCFPDEGLSGDKGHVDADVTYIVFTGKDAVLPSSALGKTYLTNFSTLRAMGDKLVGALVSNLKLSTRSPQQSLTTLVTSAIRSSTPTGAAASSSATPSRVIHPTPAGRVTPAVSATPSRLLHPTPAVSATPSASASSIPEGCFCDDDDDDDDDNN
ncbi:Chitosanase-domain-containing protein [Aspergillus ellipticus CBS 707.79]|uniref:Endo-chitosanase n=1 Tax=Aspergillus ellipticus CBS 707.79 TaxID=1448320 RepID=A0A319DI39_9EURO|nr:Chitosanase-domain-containing protein [Aspergillus ellipticus CBS 707.79]